MHEASFFYRQVFVAKLCNQIKKILEVAVGMVIFMKQRPFYSKIFKNL